MELGFMPIQLSLLSETFVSGYRTPRGLIVWDGRFCARSRPLPLALPICPDASAVPVLGVPPQGSTSVCLHPPDLLSTQFSLLWHKLLPLWSGFWTPFRMFQCTEWPSCSLQLTSHMWAFPRAPPWHFSCLCSAGSSLSFRAEVNTIP